MNRKPGDWDCPKCGELNFASRAACRKCSASRPGGRPSHTRSHGGGGGTGVTRKPGDWDCPKCDTLNFASRTICRYCPEPRPSRNEGGGGTHGGRKPGDWDCTQCGDLNFASRTHCRKCEAPMKTQQSHSQPHHRSDERRDTGSNEAMRRREKGCAVVLDTGRGTHMTMVYLKTIRQGHTKQHARQEAINWWTQRLQTSATGAHLEAAANEVRLEVGKMWGPNSIYVVGELAELKKDVTDYFVGKGWDVDLGNQGVTPHINLKGMDKSVLNSHVDLRNGWGLM